MSDHTRLVLASATGALAVVVVGECVRRLLGPTAAERALLRLLETSLAPPPIPDPLSPLSSLPLSLGKRDSFGEPSPNDTSDNCDSGADSETERPALSRSASAGLPLRRSTSLKSSRLRQEEEKSNRVGHHTADATMRAANPYLMQRGHATKVRSVGNRYGKNPQRTKVVRIALTGGPCAGKSSALEHLIRSATREGFDVLTAPEVATLYFNSSYQFPDPNSTTFTEQKFAFQRNVLKLQLQLERCYSDLAGSTGRPTIVVFDRGALDVRAFTNQEEWSGAVAELNQELTNGRPAGSITDAYLLARYDGIIHLVTAADGAAEHYKHGIVEDDSGGKVYRRETPSEAIEQDQRLQEAWSSHSKHVVVPNTAAGFERKLEEATQAVLAIARLSHPDEARRARELAVVRSMSELCLAKKAEPVAA